MEKKERITKIQEQPADSIFLVKSANGMYWKYGDHGYSNFIQEARNFTRNEIVAKLEANGFMDKTIVVYPLGFEI